MYKLMEHIMPWKQYLSDVAPSLPLLLFAQLRRDTDAGAVLAGKIVVAVALALCTGGVGGAFGAYVTLKIMDYRVTLLESHRTEDDHKFTTIMRGVEDLRTDVSVIRERHRLEEIRTTPPEHNTGGKNDKRR